MSKQVKLTLANTLNGIFGNCCPRCLEGAVFSGFYAMNSHCAECGLKFEKEPGFFLGAMLAAYFIGAFSLVPTVIILFFVMKVQLGTLITVGVLQTLILQSFLFRYSRLTWLFVERRMTISLDGDSTT